MRISETNSAWRVLPVQKGFNVWADALLGQRLYCAIERKDALPAYKLPKEYNSLAYEQKEGKGNIFAALMHCL